MTDFLGEFEVTMDAKGRFLLPAGLKKQFPDAELKRFVINRGLETCLSLYTENLWQPLFQKMRSLNAFDPETRRFQRFFLNGANYVEPDTAGRILIPGGLKEYAGLEKELIIFMAVDRIEIWDKTKYKQFFESFSQEDFSDLAKRVMGGGAEPPAL